MEDDDDVIVGGELVLSGYVGDSFMDEGFTSKQVARALASLRGDITVRLNSGGGSAFQGEAIRAALRSYPGNVTMRIEGVAASAASLIAMAGDEIIMSPGSVMMIHDPASLTMGDAADHRRSADMLDKLGETYAAVYAARSGVDAAKVREMMLAETWMTADDAVTLGFADRKDGDEKAVAAFDFTIYAHAPEHLRSVTMAKGWASQPTKAEQDAASNHKESTMAEKPKAVVEPTVETTAPAVEMKADPKAVEAAVAAERARCVGIRDAVAKARLDAEMADKLIAEGVSMDVARERIIDAWADRGDSHVYAPKPAEPKAHRMDEIETRRKGVEAAMAVQMRAAQGDVPDIARPFMDFRTLPAMAAAFTGHRGPLDTFQARQDVLMSAFHTTSDFANLLENVMNKALVARYREAAPTYRRVARQVSFADFRPHPMVKMGDFPEMEEVAENGEIKFGTFGDSKETVAVKSYGVGAKLSRQIIINDTLNGIQQVLADRGRAVARFEDKTFYAMMLGGSGSDGPTLLETGRQVFNTTDVTKAGSGAAISVTSLSQGRAAMRKKKSVGGDALLDVSAAILLVGPDKETEAQQVVAPIQAQQAGNVNPFSGSLEVVTTARITGNAWYMFADPSDVPCFIYGFLDGFEAPRVRLEEPFGMQGLAMTVEHDFGVGAVDFRGGWKNAGA